MTDVTMTNERFTFSCPRCGREFVRDYEVRRVTIAEDVIEVFRFGGQPASPPRSGIRCPSCGGLRVRVIAHDLLDLEVWCSAIRSRRA